MAITIAEVEQRVTQRQRVAFRVELGRGTLTRATLEDDGSIVVTHRGGTQRVIPRHKYKGSTLRYAYWLAGAAGTGLLVACGFFAHKVGAPGVPASTDTDWIEFAAMLGAYAAPLIMWPTTVPRAKDHRLLVALGGAAVIFGLETLYKDERKKDDERTHAAD